MRLSEVVPYICSLGNELIKSGKRGVARNFMYLYLRSPFARYSFNYLETLQRLILIGNNNKLCVVFTENVITHRAKNLTFEIIK